MSKQTDNYMALASALGFRYDEVNNVLYGQKDGYDVILYAESTSSPYLFSVHTAARNEYGANLTKEQLKELSKTVKPLGVCSQDGNNVIVILSAAMGKRVTQDKLKASVEEGLNGLTAFLREKGFTPCCSICGKNETVSGHKSAGSYYHLCQNCEISMREKIAATKTQKRENVVGGVVGALLGSLLGVVCIVLMSQLGYVAALSGVIMAIGVLKGYELLGGKLTKKGIVICIVVMLLMTYIGDRVDWALQLYRDGGGADAGFNVFECYRAVPQVIAAEKDALLRTYLLNLVLLYVFLLLGAVPTIHSKIKAKQQEGRMVKLGSVSEADSNLS